MNACVPRYVRAVLDALAFQDAGTAGLTELDRDEWEQTLEFCDRAQLTLMLGRYAREALPEWVAARIDENTRRNKVRFESLKAQLVEIMDALDAGSIDHIVLKGFTHSPELTPDPVLRAQGDCDLWCARENVFAAREALTGLGYVPLCESNGRHLAPMARPSDWQWDGDYYSPRIPVAVDLHYQLWDEGASGICAPGEEAFWRRRRYLSVDGRETPALCPSDTMGFAALHLLMHLLAGDIRLQRAWEIGHFLHGHAHDGEFWAEWREDHPEQLRRIEVIVYLLVARWFACELHDLVLGEAEQLPADVKLWIERYGDSPIEGLFQANKKELWLHLSLAASSAEKIRVFCRRVVPVKIPASLRAASAQRGAFFRARLLYHVRALLPTLASGARWRWERTGLTRGYLGFLTASVLLDVGMFVFVVLYNLYLLDLGLHEDVMGRVAGGMTAGTFAGAVPAAWLTRRIGLRNTLLTAILGLACASFLRTAGTHETTLVGASFLAGLFFSCWAVSFSPAIAGLSEERNRPLAFSLVFSVGMVLGILGGVAAGRLPGLLMHLHMAHRPADAKRLALVLASGFVALAAIPLFRLRFAPPRKAARNIYPRGRFIVGFLISLSVWSLATGAFNPFFNAYFERLHFSVERVGNVFSWAQLCEAGAVLAAPLVLRRFGEVGGIVATQLATALMLVLLAPGFGGTASAAVYVTYMSVQFMTGPTLYSMLMSRVGEQERGGASALNFLVTSLTGALSAVAGGAAIARLGYAPVLVVSSILAACGALLFRTLLRDQQASFPERTLGTVAASTVK